MNPISKYTMIMITLILTSIHVLMLPAEAMKGHMDPAVTRAQIDAVSDMGRGGDLHWFAYGAGCWMFAVIHGRVNDPPVPSDRLLGKSPEYVNTYTDTYKRSIKIRRMEMSAIGWGVSLGATLWLWNIFTD